MGREWLAFAESILNAGGWTVVVFLVVVIGIGLWRGWWVLRPWYREKADEVMELRRTVKSLTAQLSRERNRRKSDEP
jgi:uncharacterized membrane protein YciS (DUF1049 family)